MITVGFTGTQLGMNLDQCSAVWEFLKDREFVGVHGDCIGADSMFDTIARRAPGFQRMTIRPCNVPGKRAFCKPGPNDILYGPVPPLVRNKQIIAEATVVIATPKEMQMTLRSGTWSTVRYARQAKRDVFVAFPNGAFIPWVDA